MSKYGEAYGDYFCTLCGQQWVSKDGHTCPKMGPPRPPIDSCKIEHPSQEAARSHHVDPVTPATSPFDFDNRRG